ncbi:hypothetical protein OG897_34405 [Streptomyces sp. NBC_00237]|uniref:hypothetical protein n=1 Tax=Streptomyces sp. NBC_00237 TaxID=2975687 RepID=UPI002250AE69|nr:hypothetical protein [Streptomyces sp. NBC_00237]MCX5206486.1 hypothetical protein [Streptomyces sp. NBC_00237]
MLTEYAAVDARPFPESGLVVETPSSSPLSPPPDTRHSLWLRVREFAVPPTMIETAARRRLAGDWAGACAAAGVDVDIPLRDVRQAYGKDFVGRVRDDLRDLVPDLLRWHLPRIAPDGLLRPGLTIPLARYEGAGPGVVWLVVRTPPAWADAGQRVSLALWDGARGGLRGVRGRSRPSAHPDRRFRFDLHRHLWDARRAGELGVRAGVGPRPGQLADLPHRERFAVDRWADEARLLLREDTGRDQGVVQVRVGRRHRVVLDVAADEVSPRVVDGTVEPGIPVLPDAATWVLPDLELLRAGLIDADGLHPLVAPVLVPGYVRAPAAREVPPAGRPRYVDCRGARHRIGLVDGVLVALDHEPTELRREELLVELTGTPLPCLRAIDEAHRNPHCLRGVRERLDHGDVAGALAVVEGLLGPAATLRSGALQEELEDAARRRVAYGLFRVGIDEPGHDWRELVRRGGELRRPRARPRTAQRD